MPLPCDQTIRFWTVQLYREFDRICFHYKMRLRRPFIQVTPSCSNWGTWDSRRRTIGIAVGLIESYDWCVVVEVLKHEIAHQIVQELWRSHQTDHGPLFQKACEKLGMSQWGRTAGAKLEDNYRQWLSGNHSNKKIDRIGKLLRLANSSNENEAFVALKLAQRLAAEGVHPQFEGDSFVFVLINHRKKIIASYQNVIAALLVEHFAVEVIAGEIYDAQANCEFKTLEIMGTHSKVKIAEHVYYFLFNNLPIFWRDYRKRTSCSGRAKNSYYLGVLSGFAEKLGKSNSFTHSGGPGIVKVEQEALSCYRSSLNDFVRFRHPRLTQKKWSIGDTTAPSYTAGLDYGRQLSINQGVEDGKRRRVRQLTSGSRNG